jgi:hypothetical protein
MTWPRRALGALGLAAIGYAVTGAVTDGGDRLVGHLLFLVGVLFVDDLLVIPVALAVGWVLARYLPQWARGAVQVGLFASAVVTAIALPFVLGAGRLPDNPSKFPLDYGRGLAIVLGVVWVAVGAWLTLASARRRGAR